MKTTRIIFILLLTSSFESLSCHFNPIICDNGKPFTWHGAVRQGILGWLDVPSHVLTIKNKDKIIDFDRILVLNSGGCYQFIHPCDPDLILPEGLYCWQSCWRKFTRKKETGYRGLHVDSLLFEKYNKHRKHTDKLMPLRPTPMGLAYTFNQEKNQWGRFDQALTRFVPFKPACDQLFYGPQFPAEQYIQTDSQFQNQEFYDVMGVTENYMREFLGTEPDQFDYSKDHRHHMKTSMPSTKYTLHYFPLNSPDFSSRKILDTCKALELITLEELRKKTNKKSSKPGKISYEQTGSGQLASVIQGLKSEKPEETVVHVITCFNGLENELGNPLTLLNDVQASDRVTDTHSVIARKYYHEPVNLAQDLEHLETKHGQVKKIKDEFKAADIAKLKIGWCSNNKNNYVLTALPCIQKKVKIPDDIAQEFLQATFESAIRTAVLHEKSKLILCPEQATGYGYKLDKLKSMLKSETLTDLIAASGLQVIIVMPESDTI